jgi:hypothetical protein
MNVGKVAWMRVNPEYKLSNVTAVPKHRPKISFEVYPVKISYEMGDIIYEFVPGRIENNFQWGSVEVYMQQMNSVEISLEEEKQVDMVV